jgi:hypothetical protein
MDEPKPLPPYDNNKVFGPDELLPEPNRQWLSPDEAIYIRPKPLENVFRAILNFKLIRKKALAIILGYSERTIDECIKILEDQGLIRDLGQLTGPIQKRLPGNYYEKGENSLRHRPIFCVAPKKKSEKEEEELSRNTSRNVYFSQGRFASRHVQMVSESVLWFMERLSEQGYAAIAYPESILRQEMGWYSVKTEKHQSNKVFLTEIPDAWIILDGGGIRVEVQLSPDAKDDVQQRCEAAPHGEALLYIVDRIDLYKRYFPLQEKNTNLMVMFYDNDDSFRDIFVRYAWMLKQRKMRSWPLRNYYSTRGFAYCMVNPIHKNYNGNRKPEIRKILELDDKVDLQREIFQPGKDLGGRSLRK